jgi:hypothetical protein
MVIDKGKDMDFVSGINRNQLVMMDFEVNVSVDYYKYPSGAI